MVEHNKIIKNSNIIKRENNLRKILYWWNQGNIDMCLTTLINMKDTAVSKDFLEVTFGSKEENEKCLQLLNIERS
jgi:hypothetical protein